MRAVFSLIFLLVSILSCRLALAAGSFAYEHFPQKFVHDNKTSLLQYIFPFYIKIYFPKALFGPGN
jgi:hypothetical protein